MEFGRVPEKELKKVDFSLPRDPAINKTILAGKKQSDPKVYIGCAKWGRPEWVGKIYPPKTKERNFLKYYVEHYNSIELNATHYKIYGSKAAEKWAEKAKGKDFLFCPKMYKGITHYGKLATKKFLVNEFMRGMAGFGQHLGPIFVQVDERFSPNRREELFTFLAALPKEYQYFLELRHPGWFKTKEFITEIAGDLNKLGIGFVITDSAGRRDCAHMHLSIEKTFIRYVGNSLHPTDYTRIDNWVKRMKSWLKNGIREIYFFMHMHEEATSPELTVYLVDKMNKECKLDLIKPKFIS